MNGIDVTDRRTKRQADLTPAGREYRKRRERGVCVGSGCQNATRGRSYCRECVDLQRLYNLRYLARLFPKEAFEAIRPWLQTQHRLMKLVVEELLRVAS